MAAHLTGSTPGRRIGYFPALDGIRAFTILAVFAFHGEGSNYLPSGYLSVATFFTLSGFLITSLLTSEYDSAYRIQLRTFWSRRFRRLLPVSWLTLLFVAGPYSWWFATGAQLTKIRGDVVASLFQVVNWRFILDGRAYFEATGRPSPLHHFWTLAIEEQFYILFPLLVVLVYRGRHRRRTLAGVLLVLAIGSAVLGVVVLGGDRAYFGTDTRAAEILIGALLAVWMRTPAPFRTAGPNGSPRAEESLACSECCGPGAFGHWRKRCSTAEDSSSTTRSACLRFLARSILDPFVGSWRADPWCTSGRSVTACISFTCQSSRCSTERSCPLMQHHALEFSLARRFSWRRFLLAFWSCPFEEESSSAHGCLEDSCQPAAHRSL